MVKRLKQIANVIVVSDTHIGCRLGLCPPEGCELDDGGHYTPSKLQKQVWKWWREFWDVWVPEVCHNEPYVVVFNGDAIDGTHHGATSQISHNLEDQVELAYKILQPVAEKAARYYHIRGTEVHIGKSGSDEERLAKRLGAIPNAEKQFARWDLWLDIGGRLIHFLHHIGTTSSAAYEATAVGKEMVEEMTEAARWREQPPDIIVRSHRHRNYEVRMPTANGYGIAMVTPSWQLKTPYTWRLAGARLSPPQIGGAAIRLGDHDFYTRSRVWTIGRTPREKTTL